MTKDYEHTSYIMNVVYNIEDEFINYSRDVEWLKRWINQDENKKIPRPSGLKLIHAKHVEETGIGFLLLAYRKGK